MINGHITEDDIRLNTLCKVKTLQLRAVLGPNLIRFLHIDPKDCIKFFNEPENYVNTTNSIEEKITFEVKMFDSSNNIITLSCFFFQIQSANKKKAHLFFYTLL